MFSYSLTKSLYCTLNSFNMLLHIFKTTVIRKMVKIVTLSAKSENVAFYFN